MTKPDHSPNVSAWLLQTAFEYHARLTPNALALVFDQETLTYAELENRANKIADLLRRQGLGADQPVAMLTERTTMMIAGLLGILKAGGAFLPLDPDSPVERLEFMLGDSQAHFLLIQKHLRTLLPAYQGSTILLEQAENTDLEAITPTTFASQPGNLAYILYTSGSTGKPKAVMVSHQNASGVIQSFDQFGPAYEQASGISVCPYNFDVFIWEVFSVLSFGGTLHLLQPALFTSTFSLAEYLVEYSITSAYIPPALLNDSLTTFEISPQPPALRRLLVGVEPIKQATLQGFRNISPAMQIINGYGPTETTICSTCFNFGSQVNPDKRTPIGLPLEGYQLYLLDEDFTQVPIGVPGEMYIGGIGVARGYMNKPGLTAEKFLPDPFSSISGARMYKTGDMAQYLPDGNVEFIGRSDFQVKIRGFRVELGEIEAALEAHPEISKAVVIAAEDQTGALGLSAFVVPQQEYSQSPAGLRTFLKKTMPEYMVPAQFILTDTLPLTANGKVDRRALQAQVRGQIVDNHIQPFQGSPTQQALANIWKDAFRLPVVSKDANFFDLGGHSLLAAIILGQIRQIFHVDITLRSLFETPTLAGLAEKIDGAKNSPDKPGAVPVEKTTTLTGLPLSDGQRRLWFIHQLEPTNPMHHLPIVFWLHGELDTNLLEKCIVQIVTRHQALRVTIHEVDFQPTQTIGSAALSPLKTIDLRGLPSAEKERKLQEQFAAEAALPFSLLQGPLLRMMLARLEDDAYKLLLTIHHIAFDGWSTAIFLDELGVLYQAQGQAALPDLDYQYPDYALWQQQKEYKALQTAHLAYWREQLSTGIPLLSLPVAGPDWKPDQKQGAITSREIPTELIDRLQLVGHQQNASLYMALLAVFEVLLYQYTGQTNMVIGTVVGTRARPEFENLIGFFVNTLPLICNVSGNPKLSELIERTRTTTLELLSHAEAPLEKIVSEINLPSEPGANSFFKVVFALNDQTARIKLPELTIEFCEELSLGATEFDLSITIDVTQRQPKVLAEYNTRRFQLATMERFIQQYCQLMEYAGRDSGLRVAEFPSLMEDEALTILSTWNHPPQAEELVEPVHKLFETWAKKRPDGLAVVGNGSHLTYEALNQHAEQIAAQLKQLGVGPDLLVGVCMERSLEMVVALLAILKAGGGYVALDPAHPSERLLWMLDDIGRHTPASGQIILTTAQLEPRIVALGRTLVCVDLAKEPEPGNSGSLSTFTSPSQAAYVIYTSGSTGRPKGVVISISALSTYIQSARQKFGFTPQDRSLQFASISFDVAAEEIFTCLTSGACLVLRDEESIVSSQTFWQYCRDQAVSVVTLPTAYWHELVSDMSKSAPALPAGLRLVVVGGERLLRERLADWRKLAPASLRLVNAYGPTETTISSVWCDLCGPETISDAKLAPIGMPVPACQVFVLNTDLQPVTIGVEGELYISGATLARGYLNNAGRTAELFIPNPFGPAGSRMYRTGDRVRWTPGGSLEFVGRVDHQVKIRGFRIEIGEIESVLRQHPAVIDCLVTLQAGKDGENRLAAYVVTNPERPIFDPLSIASFLKERLPDYMQPGAWSFLHSFPLTISGKIDRLALPNPTPLMLNNADQAPANLVEQVVATTMAEVLGVKVVGRSASFFDLGGHSLLATQVISRLRATFRTELPLISLFEKKTPAALAEEIYLREAKPGQAEQIARLFIRISQMSEEEVKAMLQARQDNKKKI